MAKKVKRPENPPARGKRAYDSTRRQAQAAETRRQILEAARELFTERGYVATTMEAIAGEAGVAVETVYAGFGTKRALLSRLVGMAVVGDDQPIPLIDRPEIQATIREHDQRRQIRMFARQMRGISERVGPIWHAMRVAEQVEPDIAELVRDGIRGRFSGMSQFVVALCSNGPLRDGLTPSLAAETVWTLTSAEVHRLLTVDRGWSGDRFEDWLNDALVRLLLP
jgi:AcrR family transcriptional regulator